MRRAAHTYSLALAFAAMLLPSSALAATLQIFVAGSSVAVGDTFTANVLVSSSDQAMNAVSGVISFPNDLVAVTMVSKSGSILPLWVQDPTFSNSAGTVEFSGLVPNPGWTGLHGQVVTIQFRAIKAGDATLTFSSSAVLANDGNGTDILSSASSQSVSILPAQQRAQAPIPAANSTSAPAPDLLARITSSSHPDQEQWYARKHVVLDWTVGAGVGAVRLGYDNDPNGKPAVLYTDPIAHKELDLDDGVWYFHVQERGAGSWGPVATYKLQIDTTPPHAIALSFPSGADTNASTIPVLFATTDDLSGIDHYALSLDGAAPTEVTAQMGASVYQLSASAGEHSLTVTAFDRAGNAVSATGTFVSHFAPPSFTVQTGLGTTPMFIAMCLIAAAILGFWFLFLNPRWHRVANVRPSATSMRIHEEFEELRQTIDDELETLAPAGRRKTESPEERLLRRLKLKLERVQARIISDIERMKD